MDRVLLPFSATSRFSKLFTDYIELKHSTLSLYRYEPSVAGMAKAIKDLSIQKTNRNLLVQILEKQHSGFSGERTRTNIRLLKNENCFTVTTGHQLCLFGGPLYFFYKIITTISLSRELKKFFPDFDFVPVYWMATEDHDFEEINHVNLFGKKLAWEINPVPGSPVGRIPTRELAEIFSELEKLIGGDARGMELVSFLKETYLESRNLSEATRKFVLELFADEGLLVLDPDDADLKKEFLPEMERDIFEGSNFKHVTQTNNYLKASDYDVQVNPREINVFFINKGRRERLEMSGPGKFRGVDSGIKFSEAELRALLKNEPGSFSPNVVLRPMFQQKILPNLAYIGGPGELSYWLEYFEMFNQNRMFFPVLMPRNHCLFLDIPTQKKLKNLGFSTEEIFLPENVLIKRFIEKNSTVDIDLSDEGIEIGKQFDSIRRKAASIDPTLVPALEGELKRQEQSLENFRQKMMRALKNKNEVSLNQIKKVREKVFPNGNLQERVESFIPFHLKYGKNFLKEIQGSFDPFEKKFVVLLETEKKN